MGQNSVSHFLHLKKEVNEVVYFWNADKHQSLRQVDALNLGLCDLNLGYNILELYNVSVQIRLTTSKTNRDI